jgi:LPS-assembly protein
MRRLRLAPLALAAGLLAAGSAARAQPTAAPSSPASAPPFAPTAAPSSALPPAGPGLEPSLRLAPAPRGDAARRLPIVLQANSVRAVAEIETVAEGDVEFRRGGLVIRADRLSYDTPQDLARATGRVQIDREGQRYRGPELQLRVQRFEGYFLEPQFEFFDLGAGGRAARIDFIDSTRSRATQAEYSSCPRDTPEEPAWLLRAERVDLDLERNEGRAEGAVLRFLGTPILALPALSFPLSDARKSGWLPPSINTDNRSGIEISAPYYWNIAPNRDATLTPRLITRRGVGLDTEFRYLEPRFRGTVQVDWLPRDRITRTAREALQWQHEGQVGPSATYAVEFLRVSDDDWWKDFPGAARSFAPRLLPSRARFEQPFALAGGNGLAYARVAQWQVLQGSEALVVSPYERTPQLGARWSRGAGRDGEFGLQYGAEAEFNRFTLPPGDAARAGRTGGDRAHLTAYLSRPWREGGWWLVPRLAVNAAAYADIGALADTDRRLSRVLPSLSIDTGIELERRTQAFGREFTQTLEPRVFYLRRPYKAQSQLPNYDAAAKDFNFVSIYSDNPFSGIDRVADANQVTAGVTSRFIDGQSGAEALRLGLVQRYLFRDQLIAPQADGTPDGPPLTQRLSDALLLGSTSLVPNWTLDAAVQYSPDLKRSVRSIVGARWSPGPFRTLGATYRLARGLSEQLEVGWQWPIYGSTRSAAERGGDKSCAGTLYTVGRVNYSMKDSRITDSVLGFEYDAGCWIGRFVAERLSTGRSEATTRLMFQLELVGLSRIGSNPLRVLKDNVPGYRLLREDRPSTPFGGSAADPGVVSGLVSGPVLADIHRPLSP